jgi:hypothetical protein
LEFFSINLAIALIAQAGALETAKLAIDSEEISTQNAPITGAWGF